MKISHYLKAYPYEDKPGYLLLYSTKKGSMTLLSEECLQIAKKWPDFPVRRRNIVKTGYHCP